MREILFRGKRKENGYWIDGGYFEYRNFSGEEVYCIVHNGHSNDIIHETLGQYTGLTDKNGTKIFEGDIVKLYLIDGIETGVIRYSENACRFTFYENNIMGYGFDNTCIFEIIGNIHDNPELLGGDTE